MGPPEGAGSSGWSGFHPGFFNLGGGGGQHQCHCAATHVTRGGDQIYYRKSESKSEIVGVVTYFRGGSRIFHLRFALGTLHSQKIFNFSNQFPAFWWDLKLKAGIPPANYPGG